ncbi:MAG: TerB family tellurite resistance protein [Sandaracinaceae bacterium]|nr:TerB family tellurite resistance protein [Sandaracinaceae bacterium]
MGVFDGFQGSNVQLDPKLALAAGMIYVHAADGHLAEDERYDLLKVIPDDATINRALQYVRMTQMPAFIQQCNGLLTPQQKMCMLLNMADTAMGDGHMGDQERALLVQFQQAFGIPDTTLTPYVQALMIKNGLHVFGL